MRAVDTVLGDIGAGDRPRLLVLNKVDRLDEEQRRDLFLRHPHGVQISAQTGEGVDVLGERIEEALRDTLEEVELLVPYRDGGRLAELHELDGELRREDTPAGVKVTARIPAPVVPRYAEFSTNGLGA